jgi:hypothetical protein
VDWFGLAKDRNRRRALVNSVLNLRAPWNAGKLSSGLTSSGLSVSAQLHIVSYLVFVTFSALNIGLCVYIYVFHLQVIFANLVVFSCAFSRFRGSRNKFVTILFFPLKGCWPHAKFSSLKTTPCHLSTTAYSIYSQLPSIAGGRTSIRNPRTRHAVVTMDSLWDITAINFI